MWPDDEDLKLTVVKIVRKQSVLGVYMMNEKTSNSDFMVKCFIINMPVQDDWGGGLSQKVERSRTLFQMIYQ